MKNVSRRRIIAPQHGLQAVIQTADGVGEMQHQAHFGPQLLRHVTVRMPGLQAGLVRPHAVGVSAMT